MVEEKRNIVDEVLGERRVSLEVTGSFIGTSEGIDRYMTSKKGGLELTQGQDVRGWCERPDEIAGIQSNLLNLLDRTNSFERDIQVLDVGCYAGYLYDYLCLFYPDPIYTGVDILPSVIEAAKHIHKAEPNASFVVGDVYKLMKQFEPRSFDVVCCYRLVIHLPYFKKILHNLLHAADEFVHIALLVQDRDMCQRIEETDLDTGKKAIYYRRYISEETIKEAVDDLPATYKIIPPRSGGNYSSLFIERT
jgi:SAM-dependent methyltransferase